MEAEPQPFDINWFPKEEGIIFLGISMSKIGNVQSPVKCYEFLEWFDTKVNKTEGIGLVTFYADYLYFHSDEKASVLRDRYKELMLAHKNGFLNLIAKNNVWIKKAFSFYTFGQLMLDNAETFVGAYAAVQRLYRSDPTFKALVHKDCLEVSDEVRERGAMFILEEITVLYLACKGKLSFNNKFVAGSEKWVLQAYPGGPLLSEIYLFQKNPLKLSNPKNKYENHYYDLEAKVLYDYSKIKLK